MKSTPFLALALLFGPAVIPHFFRELRYSARGLLRTPVWTAGLVLTIALGIGSTAAVDGFARGLRSTEGMTEIGGLLRLASMAVLAIACANVASFLLARATARARETAVRVALGAGRGQLVRHVLADSLLIAIGGASAGAWFAWWAGRTVPAMLFKEDADRMVFEADPAALGVVTTICMALTVACGLLPLIETRHDDPGAIMQRENSGPSRAAVRIGSGLVLVQMAACTLLVMSASVLLSGFRASLQTAAGLRLSSPAVASMESLQASSKAIQMTNGLSYFAAAEKAARDIAGATSIAWTSAVPGNRPSLRTYEVESSTIPRRALDLDTVPFSGRTLDRIAMPPAAGRLFGTADAGPCGGVVLSTAAASLLGGETVVGRSIELPSGAWADVIGVVRPLDEPAAARVYHYGDDGERRDTYRVPVLGESRRIDLDTIIVSSNYFDFMALRVVAGRAFDARRDACRVAMVNEQAADQVFGGDAVGSALIDRLGQRTSIIGVLTSTRLRKQQRAVAPAVYFPYAQDFIPRMTMLMETKGADTAVLSRLHVRLMGIPGGREDRIIVSTLFDHMSRTAFAPERIATVLISALAAIALALGALALYGAMNEAARRRRREFALRVALGARDRHLISQVVAEGAKLVIGGVVAGGAAAWMVSQSLARVAPMAGGASMLAWLTAPLLLGAAVVAASVLPARKAVASDPQMIMRAE